MACLLIFLNCAALAGALWGLGSLALSASSNLRKMQQHVDAGPDPATSEAVGDILDDDLLRGIRQADAAIGSTWTSAIGAARHARRDFLLIGSSVLVGTIANVFPLVWAVDPLFP